jgi:hypothetical protein
MFSQDDQKHSSVVSDFDGYGALMSVLDLVHRFAALNPTLATEEFRSPPTATNICWSAAETLVV